MCFFSRREKDKVVEKGFKVEESSGKESEVAESEPQRHWFLRMNGWFFKNIRWVALFFLIVFVLLSVFDRFVVVNRLTRNSAVKHLNEVPPGYDQVGGAMFTYTLVNLMELEKDRVFGGYRPDNIFWFGWAMPYDNVENFQIGVLEVVQRTVIFMKERVSRVGGGSDEFNKYLVKASESLNYKKSMPVLTVWQINDGLRALENYAKALKADEANFVDRTDALYDMLRSYRELLGDTHRNLAKEFEKDGKKVSMFDTDDYYYQSLGQAYAILYLMKAARVEFDEVFEVKRCEHFYNEMEASLARTVSFRPPWVVLDGDINTQFWPNHRSNLETPINDARQKIISMMESVNR